jgi:hypothetical protein
LERFHLARKAQGFSDSRDYLSYLYWRALQISNINMPNKVTSLTSTNKSYSFTFSDTTKPYQSIWLTFANAEFRLAFTLNNLL